MRRRGLLASLAGLAALVTGCAGPEAEVERRPAGEVDVAFRTEADWSYELRLELVDADGRVVDTMVSGFPPEGAGAPSFYAGGLANGPFAMTIETEADEESLEWPVVGCPRLDVQVTVLGDGRLEVARTCAGA